MRNDLFNGQAAQALSTPATALPPLAVDIRGLSNLLQRSVASLHRDNAAGRLPKPVKIGASVRWIVCQVEAWLAAGCPPANEFAAKMENEQRRGCQAGGAAKTNHQGH